MAWFGYDNYRVSKWERKIRNSHMRSFDIRDTAVEKYSETFFVVKSQTISNLKYEVVKIDDICACHYKCEKCPYKSVCIHTFKCECPDYDDNNNICKHIHAVVRIFFDLKSSEDVDHESSEDTNDELSEDGNNDLAEDVQQLSSPEENIEVIIVTPEMAFGNHTNTDEDGSNNCIEPY